MSRPNHSSMLGHEQLVQDQRKALDQLPHPKDERLPAYGEIPSRHGPVELLEKDDASTSTKSSKTSSFASLFKSKDSTTSTSSKGSSTFKSILTGDVHKHNPRFKLEDSLDSRLYSRK